MERRRITDLSDLTACSLISVLVKTAAVNSQFELSCVASRQHDPQLNRNPTALNRRHAGSPTATPTATPTANPTAAEPQTRPQIQPQIQLRAVRTFLFDCLTVR